MDDLWISRIIYGYLCMIMDVRDVLWITMDKLRTLMRNLYSIDYSWISMDTHGRIRLAGCSVRWRVGGGAPAALALGPPVVSLEHEPWAMRPLEEPLINPLEVWARRKKQSQRFGIASVFCKFLEVHVVPPECSEISSGAIWLGKHRCSLLSIFNIHVFVVFVLLHVHKRVTHKSSVSPTVA